MYKDVVLCVQQTGIIITQKTKNTLMTILYYYIVCNSMQYSSANQKHQIADIQQQR